MLDEKRYQVFVSSTFTDLKEERDKVLQAILELRAFPAGMELFPAADEEQFDFIKREIDSSDYYVVIIGGRYGSVAPDGLSYTEKEYDYARATGKPVLAFIVQDLGKLIADRVEKSEQLRDKLRLFTEKAKSGKLVKFFSNPDELKAAVLISLPSQFNLRPMRGWVRAGQASREILEKVTTLQERVIDLEAENAQLRAAQQDSSAQLANGTAKVRWNLNLRDVRMENKRAPQADFIIETTWDDAFRLIFPGDKSEADVEEIRTTIAVFILEAAPADAVEPSWQRELAEHLKHHNWSGNWESVRRVATDLQRQFSGLGLIQEVGETRYIADGFGGQAKPRTVRLWKLTNKGATHLALISGHRNETE